MMRATLARVRGSPQQRLFCVSDLCIPPHRSSQAHWAFVWCVGYFRAVENGDLASATGDERGAGEVRRKCQALGCARTVTSSARCDTCMGARDSSHTHTCKHAIMQHFALQSACASRHAWVCARSRSTARARSDECRRAGRCRSGGLTSAAVMPAANVLALLGEGEGAHDEDGDEDEMAEAVQGCQLGN